MDKSTAEHWLSPAHGGPSSTLKPEATPMPRVTELLEAFDDLGTIELGVTIGTGGAGVVREAQQIRLQRAVAAKQLQDPNHLQARSLLLQEALVLGQLEHPNIVPVHDVVIDELGQLTLLMKRIDGDPWTRWLDDPDGLRQRFDTTDVLGFHLGVLKQVCDAMAFAHSRGVLHRDLKPDNVMVGAFGEVVVVDWGIAAGLSDDAPAPRPRPNQVAGTPKFMAPEMWSAPHTLSPATDVYLLGALLYRILCGTAPHQRRSDEEHADGFRPHWPDDAPDELTHIAERALQQDPEQRYPSVSALRKALDAYDAHRGAASLAHEARRRMTQFDADPETCFQDVAFRLKVSLEQWPENKDAANTLTALHHKMARWYLTQDDPRSAARILKPEQHPEAALVDAIDAALRRLEEAERSVRQLDPRVGANSRAHLGLLMGLIWATIPLVGHFATQGRPPTRGVVYGGAAGLLLITTLALSALRHTLNTSSLSRQLFGWILLTPLLQAVMSGGLDLYGVPIPGILNAQFFLWGTMCLTASLVVDRRLAIPGVGFLVAYYVAMLVPGQRYLVMFFPNLLLAITTAVVYRKPRKGLD